MCNIISQDDLIVYPDAGGYNHCMATFRVIHACCVLILLALLPHVARADDVTFRNHVMPILAKAGCNSGACHGNMNGKGGFKLSLRGESPALDLETISRSQLGRRVNLTDAVDSLLLRKATASIAHEGGKRFAVGSLEYQTLHDWIAAGAPDDNTALAKLTSLEVSPRESILIEPIASVQLRAMATFSDGTKRDVTSYVVFDLSNLLATVSAQGLVERVKPGEVTVTVRFNHLQQPARIAFVPARPNFKWSEPAAANFIDEHVHTKLKKLRMNPSPLADDSTFIRRAFLDVIGVLPTPDEARAFVADSRIDKRDRLIDALLERPEFNDHWALKWSDLLRNEERVLDAKGVRAFHGWIRDSIATNKPVSQFVHDLITARGSTYDNPAANFYRANRSADVRAEATAQLFLGTRMQCAKCHNHPYDRWTQNDYYSFAAFFAPIDYKIIENNPRDENDKMMFIGEQLVVMNSKNQVKHPDGGRVMKPAFLGDAKQPAESKGDSLESLAQWMTSGDNRRFAAAQINRIWFHLMSKGIVDPIDDFRDTNPPSNGPLLDALTRAFIKSNYDLRAMVKLICTSRTYQRASQPTADNEEDQSNFSHAFVRRLTAEQMLDAMSGALDAPVAFNGVPRGYRAAQIPGVAAIYRDRDPAPGDRFLRLFGKPPRLVACECERSNDTALGQVFELTSGETINDLLTHDDNRIAQMLREKKNDDQIIDELYWAALSRAPSETERGAAKSLLANVKDRRTGIEDIAWGLLNAKEFVLRR